MNKNLFLMILVLTLVVSLLLVVGCETEEEAIDEEPDEEVTDEKQDEDLSYPESDITLVVPYSPGGGFDTQARTMAPHLQQHFGENIVVENMDGAGGLVAAHSVYGSEPDGYTLLQVNVAAWLVEKVLHPDQVEFTLGDFEFVGQYLEDVRALGVHPDLDVESWDDLVEMSQEEPLLYGTAGVGSPPHKEGLILQDATDLEFEFVDYPGSAEIGGGFARDEVDVTTLGYTSFIDWEEDGVVDIACVFSEDEQLYIEHVSPAKEFGMPEDEYEAHVMNPVVGTPRGIAAPPDTPDEIVEYLREKFWNAMEDEEFLNDWEQAELIYQPLRGEEMQERVEEMESQIFEMEDFLRELEEE